MKCEIIRPRPSQACGPPRGPPLTGRLKVRLGGARGLGPDTRTTASKPRSHTHWSGGVSAETSRRHGVPLRYCTVHRQVPRSMPIRSPTTPPSIAGATPSRDDLARFTSWSCAQCCLPRVIVLLPGSDDWRACKSQDGPLGRVGIVRRGSGKRRGRQRVQELRVPLVEVRV